MKQTTQKQEDSVTQRNFEYLKDAINRDLFARLDARLKSMLSTRSEVRLESNALHQLLKVGK